MSSQLDILTTNTKKDINKLRIVLQIVGLLNITLNNSCTKRKNLLNFLAIYIFIYTAQ